MSERHAPTPPHAAPSQAEPHAPSCGACIELGGGGEEAVLASHPNSMHLGGLGGRSYPSRISPPEALYVHLTATSRAATPSPPDQLGPAHPRHKLASPAGDRSGSGGAQRRHAPPPLPLPFPRAADCSRVLQPGGRCLSSRRTPLLPAMYCSLVPVRLWAHRAAFCCC